jgi:hypothetical protein
VITGSLVVAAAAVIVIAVMAGHSHPPTSRVASLPASPPSTSTPTTDDRSPSTTVSPPSTTVASVLAVPSQPGVSVSPDEAHVVAGRLWFLRMTALSERDAASLPQFEAGPELEVDRGFICQEGCRGPVLTSGTVTVNVPRQTAWPAVFFATVTYTTQCGASVSPCDDSFVAQQISPGAPWKMILYVDYSGTLYASQPALGADGYAVAAQADATRHLEALPAEYAVYLQALKSTGRPPTSTRLANGYFTTGLASALNDPPAAQEARGEHRTVTYQAAPTDPIWRFASEFGSQVTCGTVRFRDQITPTAGHTLTQPDDYSAYGNLAPGDYATVTLTGLRNACFEVHQDPTTPIIVFGTWDHLTGATGIPAGQ